MAADAYVAKCLRTKLKTELLNLGRILGVPLRKSWTKDRMVGSIAGRYEDDPGILIHALSGESADFLRKHLRNPAKQTRMKDSIYRELEFLGLVEKRKTPVEKRESPVEGKGPSAGKGKDMLRDDPEFLFEGSGMKTFLLDRKRAGIIRRLDEMEKIVRGMLRCFGLLEEKELADMAARKCLEWYGAKDQDGLSPYDAFRKEIESLLWCRLNLRNFTRTYVEGDRTYLLHPSVTNPERLRYIILASPVKAYREFTFEELVRLGEGEETSGAVFLGLMELLGKHPYQEKETTQRNAEADAMSGDRSKVAQTDGKKLERNHLKIEMQNTKTWEEDILHIKLRIREGAPNLEIVREVMERLFFEDHQEVSRFLERFISHCDDIPRWNLKGYRMNEI